VDYIFHLQPQNQSLPLAADWRKLVFSEIQRELPSAVRAAFKVGGGREGGREGGRGRGRAGNEERSGRRDPGSVPGGSVLAMGAGLHPSPSSFIPHASTLPPGL
jgi:hypothetical protein